MQSDRDREILFLKKRIELLEKYQIEMMSFMLNGNTRDSFMGKGSMGLRLRRLFLSCFSVVDKRLVRYRKYNKIRRWIYRR